MLMGKSLGAWNRSELAAICWPFVAERKAIQFRGWPQSIVIREIQMVGLLT